MKNKFFFKSKIKVTWRKQIMNKYEFVNSHDSKLTKQTILRNLRHTLKKSSLTETQIFITYTFYYHFISLINNIS